MEVHTALYGKEGTRSTAGVCQLRASVDENLAFPFSQSSLCSFAVRLKRQCSTSAARLHMTMRLRKISK